MKRRLGVSGDRSRFAIQCGFPYGQTEWMFDIDGLVSVWLTKFDRFTHILTIFQRDSFIVHLLQVFFVLILILSHGFSADFLIHHRLHQFIDNACPVRRYTTFLFVFIGDT